MPKLSDRERLSDLEDKQRKLAIDIEKARTQVRGRYAAILTEMAIEQISEREFREIVTLVIARGGPAALAALSATDVPPPQPPGRASASKPAATTT